VLTGYQPGTGLLYRLNPLVKGFSALVLILFFSLNRFGAMQMSGALAGVLLIALISRLPVVDIILSIKRIAFLLLIVALVQGFRGNGFEWLFAAEGIVRILGVFLVAGFYLATSPQAELMHFWEVVFRPLKFFRLPARELALVMVIAVRFLPVMLSEIDRIRMAQIARGAKIGTGGWLSSAASLMPLMIPTISQALIRAEELAEAMEARGYRVSAERTRYHQFGFALQDVFAAVGAAGVFIATVLSFF